MKKVFITWFIATIFLCAPALANEGNGEYVSNAAPHGNDAVIPPGHFGIIADYADEFLSNTPHRTIYAQTLMDGINDPSIADELHDFFLLDIRKQTDFCAGHIAGAVNIPFEETAKSENLSQLPTDIPILIICYTGHTASQVNAILNLLGYNAWTLRFGMMSWREKTSIAVWSSSVKQDIYGGNYPMETCP